MPLTKLAAEVNNIQALADRPTETATQLKVIFDKAAADIKAYLNNILTVEADATFATKEEVADIYAGGVADGSVTDAKLSNTAGQIKERVATHQAEDATEEESGHVELATATETTAGIDDTRAVTPLGLRSATDLLIPLTQKGALEGIASLVGGSVPLSQLGNAPKVASGTYSGTGVAKTINIGFTPKFVIVVTTLTNSFIFFMTSSYTASMSSDGLKLHSTPSITSGGFSVGTIYASANQPSITYSWSAFG